MNKPTDNEETALATYGEWTPEQAKKEADQLQTGNNNFWKPPVGKTKVRFLPPKMGWPSPFVVDYQHFIDMPGGARAVTFSCPKQHVKRPCLVCKKADAMTASGNVRDEKVGKRLAPQRRVLANIVVDPDHAVSSVSIYGFGKTVFDALRAIREDDESGGNFMDPMTGFNLTIVREGTGRDDTRYRVMAARTASKLVNMQWIEDQTDLRRLIRIPTTEQQQRLLDGDDPKEVWAMGKDRGPRDRDADLDDPDVIDVDPQGGKRRTAEDDLFDEEMDLE